MEFFHLLRYIVVKDIITDLIKNIKMVEAARLEATDLLEKDFELKKHPLIKERLLKSSGETHFE